MMVFKRVADAHRGTELRIGLLLRSKSVRLPQPTVVVGRGPMIELLERSICCSDEVVAHCGSVPPNPLLIIVRLLRLVKVVHCDGNDAP